MSTTRIAIKLMIITGMLAAGSAPANAFFEANTAGATSGSIAKFPASTNLGISVGGKVITTVSCLPGTTATGLWTIQNSEEVIVSKGTKEQHQPATKVGPHSAITITNWGTCTATVGAEKAAATVSPCRLQAAQPAKNTAANQETVGSAQTDCVIKVPALVCTITVEQSAENHGWKSFFWKNVAVPLIGAGVAALVKKIEHKAEGAGCATIGLKEGTEGSLKTGTEGNEEFVLAAQKLI